MWIKQYLDGSVIAEDRSRGLTWMKTPLTNLYGVELHCTDASGHTYARRMHMPKFRDFWHSRTAVASEGNQPVVVAERIQGLQEDGTWFTVTWNGRNFIESIEPRAIGKPQIK